ncbi:MAG: hypothetical protein LC670_06750, partial [Flavobacteriales bacterium]|nr:hypothetical protein [Flavobacteriales bacterium]
VYYAQKDTKPDFSAFVEASFTLFIVIILNVWSFYHILSYYSHALSQGLIEVTDNPALNKWRAFPVTLGIVIPFIPVFVMIYRSIKRNMDHFMSLEEIELRKYRIWYLAACAISFILAMLSIVFFTDM